LPEFSLQLANFLFPSPKIAAGSSSRFGNVRESNRCGLWAPGGVARHGFDRRDTSLPRRADWAGHGTEEGRALGSAQ
jgi:hypothetical protein